MHRKSYTREVGLKFDERIVPLPYTCAVLVVLAAGVWFGVRELQTKMNQRQELKRTTATMVTPVQSTLAKK